MASAASRKVIGAVRVVIAVDTHRDKQTAAASDQQSVRLGERYAPATNSGMPSSNGGPVKSARFGPSGLRERIPKPLNLPDFLLAGLHRPRDQPPRPVNSVP